MQNISSCVLRRFLDGGWSLLSNGENFVSISWLPKRKNQTKWDQTQVPSVLLMINVNNSC